MRIFRIDLILIEHTDKIGVNSLSIHTQKGSLTMPLVTSTEMFKKAYDGGYAIGAFNVNNMEIDQGITEALSGAEGSGHPAGIQGRACLREPHLPDQDGRGSCDRVPGHPDRSASGPRPGLETCKAASTAAYFGHDRLLQPSVRRERRGGPRRSLSTAHAHGVVVEAELGTLAGVEDDVQVSAEDLPTPIRKRLRSS